MSDKDLSFEGELFVRYNSGAVRAHVGCQKVEVTSRSDRGATGGLNDVVLNQCEDIKKVNYACLNTYPDTRSVNLYFRYSAESDAYSIYVRDKECPGNFISVSNGYLYFADNPEQDSRFHLFRDGKSIKLDYLWEDTVHVKIKQKGNEEFLQLHSKEANSAYPNRWWGAVVTHGGNGGTLDFDLKITKRQVDWVSKS